MIATRSDLAGGHIRNAVLAAEGGVPIGWSHVIEGLRLEYRKLGKGLPARLGRAG